MIAALGEDRVHGGGRPRVVGGPDTARAAAPPARTPGGRDRDRRPRGSAGSHELLVHVAPAPVFSGLEGLDDRVPDGVRVPARVAVRGGVAAPDVPAGQAEAQVHPGRADAQAFLAAFRRARRDGPDEAQVRVGERRVHGYIGLRVASWSRMYRWK